MKNKIALVTGGSRGLGKNMALRLAENKIDVVVTYNTNHLEAEKVVAEIKERGGKAFAMALDVRKSETFAAFYERLSKDLKTNFGSDTFDYLINNAGIGINQAFATTTPEDFDLLYTIQFKAPFFMSQQALRYMNDGGGIVNVSTGLTRFSLPGYAAYASMKGAVEVMTKYQAQELGARNINVNVIAPGAIETDFAGGFVRDNENLNAVIASHTALGRVGLPDDIGGVVAFLCSPDAKWVNAQRIEVSGGQSL